MNENIKVGIQSIGTYFPEDYQTSKFIAEMSGIPNDIIINKFAINKKHKSGEKEHPSDMAIKAAKNTIGDFNPEKLDLIIYHGSEYKDYYLYNLAAKIQHEIGAKNAYAFEIHSLCASGALSMKIAKDMMISDSELKNVLLVSASKEADLLNYKNLDSRFMFNFGEGAAGILLKRNSNKNVILSNHTITDGSFADDVAVYNIGSKAFNKNNNESIDISEMVLDVKNIDSMRERLRKVTEKNFYKVIEKSVSKSGYKPEDIDFIGLIHMKQSFLNSILSRYGLTEDNSYLLNEYGHCQSADAYISVKKADEQGKLETGDLVVMVGAGTGYTWSATSVLWGEN